MVHEGYISFRGQIFSTSDITGYTFHPTIFLILKRERIKRREKRVRESERENILLTHHLCYFFFFFLFQGLLHGSRCPEDSVENENGECKCSPTCPSSPVCSEPEQLLLTRNAIPGTPGRCCPRYECIPSGNNSYHLIIIIITIITKL